MRRKNAPAVTRVPPSSTGWRIDTDQVITTSGSRVSDLLWDFRADHDAGGIIDWDRPITAGGVEIGRLSDPHYRELLSGLQQAVAVRWRYSQREDGSRWGARRAMKAAANCRSLAVWLAGAGVTSFESIDESTVVAWVRHTSLTIDGSKRQVQHHREMIDAILLPWRVRNRICAEFHFTPAHNQPLGYQSDKATFQSIPLLPKVVLDHVLGAAVRFVEVYSKDIIAARNYVNDLRKDWVASTGRPIPAYKKKCPQYDAFDAWISKRFGFAIQAARKRMKVPAPWNEGGQFLVDPDTGEPWLDYIRTRHHLQQLENSLRTACYLIIAFLTGGRNTEMNQLSTSCVHVVRGVGSSDDFDIKGFVTKGRGAEPEEVSWGVDPIAVRAAGILIEMLASWRAKTNSDRLFVTQTGRKMWDCYYNVDIANFVQRVGTPYINGQQPSVTTHMLRVALAQWLGSEPYGEVAGAFHLRQLSTQAFRGYLRTDPTFQSLYEGFVLQSSADHLEMLLEEPSLGGKMGENILRSRSAERQSELERNVRGLNLAQVGRDAPTERIIAKLRKTSRPIYLTKFSICVFSGDTAECLKDVPLSERNKPHHAKCEPLTCANSAITRLQVEFFLEDFEAYAGMCNSEESSPSQCELARNEMKRLAQVIAPHVPTLAGERRSLMTSVQDADPKEALTVSIQKRLAVVDGLLTRIAAAGLVEHPSA